MREKTSGRVLPLEGLRGLAAVSVVFYHYLVLVFPAMYYGPTAVQHARFEDNLYGSPFMSLVSGSFAVSTFFVLSGFVLAIGYFQSKDMSIIKRLATRRYVRLMVPAFVSIIIAWALIIIGLSHVEQAYVVTQSAALNLGWVQNTSFLKAIYEGSLGIFTSGSVFNYNSVLWTMKYEFLGSFIVFASVVLFGKSKYRFLIYFILMAALINTWFIGFIIGMLIADLYANKAHILEKIQPQYTVVMVAVAIFLGGFPWIGSENTIYRYLQIPGFDTLQNQAVWGAIGASLLIIAIFRNGVLQRLLSHPAMVKIGSYTYSMYLVHQPIIYTLGMALFVFVVSSASYTLSVAIVGLLLTPVIMLATVIFHKYVEIPSIRLSSTFDKLVNNEIKLKNIFTWSYKEFWKMFVSVLSIIFLTKATAYELSDKNETPS